MPARKIFHNAIYDVCFIRAAGLEIHGEIVDTMIAGSLVDENRFRYDLGSMGRDYLGIGKNEAVLKETADLWGVDAKSEMYKLPAMYVGNYAERDAELTFNLWKEMTKEIISTENAPQAIGPYSQAVKAGNLMFISGQIPLDPNTGDLVSESIEDQAKQVLDNVKSICEASGNSLDDIVKISIFLTDLNNFSVVNDVMKEYFSEPYPARATVEVSGLPLGVNVEIEAIVLING